MRVAKTLLIASLMALPTVVFADAYTQDGYPDITIDSATITDNTTYLTMSGTTGALTTGAAVESIIDVAGTGCDGTACSTNTPGIVPWPVVNVTAGATGTITICDGNTDCSDSSEVLLQANFLAYSDNGGSGVLDELFTVTSYDQNFWNLVEATSASYTPTASPTSIVAGDELLLDAHPGDGTADLTLYTPATVTPEPASMTLILGGLAAGYIRKRRAATKK